MGALRVPENAESRAEHAGKVRPILSDDRKGAVQGELERVLEGQDFRSSRRGQILLKYLVAHALAGDLDSFKERTIGLEVFGREANYDTGQDAIVRVAANDIRKRLADHYERRRTTGDPAALQISIPHGSYVPEFSEPAHPAVSTVPASTPEPSTPVILPGPSRTRRMIYAGVVLVLVSAVCALAIQNRNLRLRSFPEALPGELPWSMLADPGKQMGVVVADSSFGFAQELLGREIGLPEYTSGSWMDRLRLDHPAFTGLANVPVTSVADVIIASKLTAMLERFGYAASVRSARSLQIADLKADRPLVLLGSAYANPWVGLLSDHMNFRIQYDSKLGRQVCVNTSPRPGEQTVYVTTARTGSAGIAYATVSLVPNIQHSAFILILAGSNMEGTEAAGEFATDLGRSHDTLQRMGIDPKRRIEQLELLIRLQCMSTSSGRSEVIAQRVSYARGT